MEQPGTWFQWLVIGMEFFFSTENKEWGEEEFAEVYGTETSIVIVDQAISNGGNNFSLFHHHSFYLFL